MYSYSLQRSVILTLISFAIGKVIDDAKAPTTFYTLEPGKSGKLLFLTGPPGSGKSSVALELARNYGYKYYEGDCFFYHSCNPYIPLNSTGDWMTQPKMKVK